MYLLRICAFDICYKTWYLHIWHAVSFRVAKWLQLKFSLGLYFQYPCEYNAHKLSLHWTFMCTHVLNFHQIWICPDSWAEREPGERVVKLWLLYKIMLPVLRKLSISVPFWYIFSHRNKEMVLISLVFYVPTKTNTCCADGGTLDRGRILDSMRPGLQDIKTIFD